MTYPERQLFKAMCGFNSEHFDEELLKFATPSVLGHLFYNRMQAIAFTTLKRHMLLEKVNREFRNSLRSAYEHNVQKNESYLRCVQWLHDILNDCKSPYAMLKGALLCGMYPQGCRTSNDIDLLVLPKDVTAIGELLLSAGFRQGYIRNDQFIPASRQDIITSKMMRGETVPYIKKVDLPLMKYLEVDVNFSVDYKNGSDDIVSLMLDRAIDLKVNDISIKTLAPDDFFVHLCCHLYKEATTLPWIEMMRDMSLYKYCDIYMLLCHMTPFEISSIFERAKELGAEKLCAFAVLQMAALFEIESETLETFEDILKEDPDFIHSVVAPGKNNSLIYKEKDIAKRFFAKSRVDLLEEV